jgi:hypothetical protein
MITLDQNQHRLIEDLYRFKVCVGIEAFPRS